MTVSYQIVLDGSIAVPGTVPGPPVPGPPKSPHHAPALVRLVLNDKASFPHGLKTKLSLGDFEGNTYHRKFSVGTDNGRPYLSNALNERDEQ